jgi:hypothetical protein
MAEEVHNSNGSLSNTEAALDSFWEVGQYKRTIQRIENGDKQCNEMIKVDFSTVKPFKSVK